ncbi:MAG TPA: hypothetical protein VF002_09120 [Gaiellaceae bacterium]
MSYYAVTRVHGPAWNRSLPLREQEKWDEHAACMEAFVEEGFIVLGGPLGEDHALLIIDAEGEAEIEARLAEDLWTPMGLLETTAIERWEVLLGADTLGAPAAPNL